jgi:hypothetical protein
MVLPEALCTSFSLLHVIVYFTRLDPESGVLKQRHWIPAFAGMTFRQLRSFVVMPDLIRHPETFVSRIYLPGVRA